MNAVRMERQIPFRSSHAPSLIFQQAPFLRQSRLNTWADLLRIRLSAARPNRIGDRFGRMLAVPGSIRTNTDHPRAPFAYPLEPVKEFPSCASKHIIRISIFRHPVGSGQNTSHEPIIQRIIFHRIHHAGSVALRHLGETRRKSVKNL